MRAYAKVRENLLDRKGLINGSANETGISLTKLFMNLLKTGKRRRMTNLY